MDIRDFEIMPPPDQLIEVDVKIQPEDPVPPVQHSRYYLDDGDFYVVVSISSLIKDIALIRV